MMIEICIVILSLLQAEPRRIPIVVWVGAILVLLIGLSLLIYFLKRLKKTEKEAEEDWSLSRRSLFAEPAKASAPAPDLDFDDMPLKAGPRAVEPEVETAEELAPTLEMAQPVAPAAPEPVEEPEPETVILRSEEVEVTPQEVVLEERVTELLVSPVEPVGEGDVLGDDVWEVLHKPDTKVAAEPPLSARVEQRPQREPFEPPSIRPIAGREPFEAPRIERIVPQGNQTSERQLPPPPVTAPVEPPGSRETALPPVEPLAAREIVGSGSRKPAGTVLGIPVESSHGPLILGEPVKPKDEVGIGALANYGKETGPEGGRGGTIALLVTVVLVGGGIAAYFLVPSVHARVDSLVAKLRGRPPVEAPAPAPTPKAQIFPAASEASKNIVKARGSIYNVSTEPLENLTLEIRLERGGDQPPDIRTIPITPNRLEPRMQGRYEFEYDGSRATGYPAGYLPTKLLGKDGEVAFVMPGRPKIQQ